jgi:hypothetical protein
MNGYDEALDAFRAGKNERARQLSERALAAARSVRDEAGKVDALCMLSRVALRDGDFDRVRELADEARASAQAAGETRLERMLGAETFGALYEEGSALTSADVLGDVAH